MKSTRFERLIVIKHEILTFRFLKAIVNQISHKINIIDN